MFSSEQTFTINGDHNSALEKVLELAMTLSGTKTIESFYKDARGSTEYPFKPTTKVLVEQISQYIDDLSAEEIWSLAGEEPDIDGTVRLGWEVFHPLWYGDNKIDKYELAAVIAVRPSWIVYGK